MTEDDLINTTPGRMLKECNAQLAEVRAERDRFRNHNLHLVKTIDSNRAEDGERIAKAERELAEALAEVDGLRLELTVKDARIDVLTLDRRDTAKARDEARAQLAEARAQFVLLDNEQASANAKADRVIAELETQIAEARAQIAALTPLTEIHDAWRKLHGGEESPSQESVVRFIEFAHAAAGRAYEASK